MCEFTWGKQENETCRSSERVGRPVRDKITHQITPVLPPLTTCVSSAAKSGVAGSEATASTGTRGTGRVTTGSSTVGPGEDATDVVTTGTGGEVFSPSGQLAAVVTTGTGTGTGTVGVSSASCFYARGVNTYKMQQNDQHVGQADVLEAAREECMQKCS